MPCAFELGPIKAACTTEQKIITKNELRNEKITNIQKEFNSSFGSFYSSKINNVCVQETKKTITIEDDVIIENSSKVRIGNDMSGMNEDQQKERKASMICQLKANDDSAIQNQMATSMLEAMKTTFGSDLTSKIDSELKTQFGSQSFEQTTEKDQKIINIDNSNIGLKIKNDISNNVNKEMMNEARQTLEQGINLKKKLIIKGSSDIVFGNFGELLMDSSNFSNSMNKIINDVVNTSVVEQQLDAEIKAREQVGSKATATGFAEMFQAIGQMMASIGLVYMLPIIIIGGVLVYVIFGGGGGSSSGASTTSDGSGASTALSSLTSLVSKIKK
jgi:hypothetical protein